MSARRAPWPRINHTVSLAGRCVALATMMLLFPLALLIALAILIESGSPVFFSQQRLGLNGQRFYMWKFRKFFSAIGRNTSPLTLIDDSRCTRVGRFLAKTKLDELPQLWNVVRGEMAVVGPRPEVPDFESCFTGPPRRLLNIRPGIFGPSQVAFRSEAKLFPTDRSPEDFYREVVFPAKAALDLDYYASSSKLGDLKWVALGLLAVCKSDSQPQALLVRRANNRGLG
jgi:lipopolysaccharide/colanic/teichoic acid biosynthesis glycosyltransferase